MSALKNLENKEELNDLELAIWWVQDDGTKEAIALAESAAEYLARLESALAVAKVALQTYGFVVTLNGATGKGYLRCRDCNGDNLSLDKNEMSNHNVRHKPDCKIAAALAAVSEEAG